jgi:hypothetical protein
MLRVFCFVHVCMTCVEYHEVECVCLGHHVRVLSLCVRVVCVLVTMCVVCIVCVCVIRVCVCVLVTMCSVSFVCLC